MKLPSQYYATLRLCLLQASEPERAALACSSASEMAEKGTMLVNASAAACNVLHGVCPPPSHAHEFNRCAVWSAPGSCTEHERLRPAAGGQRVAPHRNGAQPLDEPARLACISKDNAQQLDVGKSLQSQLAERPPQDLEQPNFHAGSPSSPQQQHQLHQQQEEQQQQQQQHEQFNLVYADQVTKRPLTAQWPEQSSSNLGQHTQEQMRQRLHDQVRRHTCQQQLQQQEQHQLGRDRQAQQYDSCTAERQQLSGPSQGNGPHTAHGLHPLQQPPAEAAAACQAAQQTTDARGTAAADSPAASTPSLMSTPSHQLHGSASGQLRISQQPPQEQPSGAWTAGSRDGAPEPSAQQAGVAGAGLPGGPSEGVACPPEAGLANGPASSRQPTGELGLAHAAAGATPGNSVGSAAHGELGDGGARRSSSGLSAGGPGSVGLPHPSSRAHCGGYPQGRRASSAQLPEPAGGSRPLLLPEPEPNADSDPDFAQALGPVLSGPIRGATGTALDQDHPAGQAGGFRMEDHHPVAASALGFAGARRWPSGRQAVGAAVEVLEGGRGSQATGAAGRTHGAEGHEQGVRRKGTLAGGRVEQDKLGSEGGVTRDAAAATGVAAAGDGTGWPAGRAGDGVVRPALAVRFRPDACPELPKDRIRALTEALAAQEQEEVQVGAVGMCLEKWLFKFPPFHYRYPLSIGSTTLLCMHV